jgi:hypothetical protein
MLSLFTIAVCSIVFITAVANSFVWIELHYYACELEQCFSNSGTRPTAGV